MERLIRKNMENLDIFLEFFEELNTFSILAQNIGVAFIAILIPIAMAIFRDKGFVEMYLPKGWEKCLTFTFRCLRYICNLRLGC